MVHVAPLITVLGFADLLDKDVVLLQAHGDVVLTFAHNTDIAIVVETQGQGLAQVLIG